MIKAFSNLRYSSASFSQIYVNDVNNQKMILQKFFIYLLSPKKIIRK